MNSHDKYIKYKTKYLNLKNNINGGGDADFDPEKYTFEDLICKKITPKQWENFYDKKTKFRKKELIGQTKTNSYINRHDLLDKTYIYFIHFNGGRHYKVAINKNTITVAELDADQNTNPSNDKENKSTVHFEKCYSAEWKYDNFMILKTFQGYWYGFDASADRSHGNSLLININNNNEYMFIGKYILLFNTNEKIIDFISYVGNNDIPYPIAVGTENFYYISNNNIYVIIKNNLQTDINLANMAEIVTEIFDFNDKNELNNVNILHISYKNL